MTGSISNADFWLVMTVEVIDTDDVKETLKAQFFTKLYLHRPTFVDTVKGGKQRLKWNGASVTRETSESGDKRDDESTWKYWALQLERGQRLVGLELDGADSNSFPVNPDKFILNSVGKQEEIMKPWLRFDPESGVVSTQYAFQTVLKLSMQVARFPTTGT